jgi:hypothetical protein
VRAALGLLIAAALAGCGTDAADPSLTPRPVGDGPQFRPPSLSRAVRHAAPLGDMRCTRNRRPRFAAHLELFAAGRVVIVPAGIGLAPPRTTDGAYVTNPRCAYPLATREPTGVVEVAGGGRATLGDLFALWGRPLTPTRLAGFRGQVTAHVDGRLYRGDPRTVPLTRHAQIVVQVGPRVVPHSSYRFPPGL